MGQPASEISTLDTGIDRRSDRELVVTRTFDGPARIVFEAWTTPELLMQWWAPPSFGITFLSCEADVRPGGTYRFVFGHPESDEPMAFVGRYIEVEPNARLVWTCRAPLTSDAPPTEKSAVAMVLVSSLTLPGSS